MSVLTALENNSRSEAAEAQLVPVLGTVCLLRPSCRVTDRRTGGFPPLRAGAVLGGAGGCEGAAVCSQLVLITGSCAYPPETPWKSRQRRRSCNGGGLSSCGMFSSFSTSRFCKTWIFIFITQLILILARTRKGVLWGLIDWSDMFWTQISGWIGYLMCENRRWCL